MKKHILILTTLILALSACTSATTVNVTFLPSETTTPAEQSVIPSEMPSLAEDSTSASPSDSASASASPTQVAETVYTGTTIIATSSGEIRGGCSDGKWLTDSEAAALCKGKMTLNEYNLVDLKGKVKSSGVTHEEDEYASETSDGKGCYYLKIPKGDEANDNYSKNPLCFSYLYYGGKLPDVKTVNVSSEIKGAVQKLLDENMGKGKAKAKVRLAAIADIDGDGKKETVVNADYVSGYNNGPDEGAPCYCLSCIIESDGAVKVIEGYYFAPTADEPELNGPGFFYVQNIIDLDGDGISELVVDSTYGEESGTTVYKYDGSDVVEIMDYSVMYDIS